jgi:hypothetical protein
MGLLDALNDPEVMARIAERQRLVDHVAGQLNITPQEARLALDTADAAAAEHFCEGNVIPFRARQ